MHTEIKLFTKHMIKIILILIFLNGASFVTYKSIQMIIESNILRYQGKEFSQLMEVVLNYV